MRRMRTASPLVQLNLRSSKRQTDGDEDQGFEALVAGQRAHRRWQRDRPAAREQAVLAEIEPDDLMDALDPHIERAAVLGDRFGVEPAVLGERAAIGAEDRRHLGLGDAAGARPVVEDAAAQPPAVVAQGDEMRAIGRDSYRRDAAELL